VLPQWPPSTSSSDDALRDLGLAVDGIGIDFGQAVRSQALDEVGRSQIVGSIWVRQQAVA
jgi:hypothetical protein